MCPAVTHTPLLAASDASASAEAGSPLHIPDPTCPRIPNPCTMPALSRPAPPQHRQLELFFPFDPYLLRRSAAHLSLPSTYIRWRRGHPSGAVRAQLESESSSDSDEDGEELSDSELSELEEEGAAAAGTAGGGESSSSDDDSDSSSSSGSSGYDSSSESDEVRSGCGVEMCGRGNCEWGEEVDRFGQVR